MTLCLSKTARKRSLSIQLRCWPPISRLERAGSRLDPGCEVPMTPVPDTKATMTTHAVTPKELDVYVLRELVGVVHTPIEEPVAADV